MLRFFLSDDGKIARVYTETHLYQQCYDGGVQSYDRSKPGEASPIDNQLECYRELTAADFLRETRGKPISDKALELLAEERGVKCFANCSSHWVCGANRRICIDLYGTKPFDGQFPNDIENHRVPPTDLPTILASEPGKRHREAIEEFILSLPVVSRETEPAAKERTLLDVVRGVTDARICSNWQAILLEYAASDWNAAFDRIFCGMNGDDCEAEIWVRDNLGINRCDFARHDYKRAIARKLGLVGEVAEAVKESRETFFVYCDDLYECELEDCTESEAVKKLRGMCDCKEYHGCTLSLFRPVLLKTLRSVEKTTYEIEEVPNVQGN